MHPCCSSASTASRKPSALQRASAKASLATSLSRTVATDLYGDAAGPPDRPVATAVGHTYEREAITQWLTTHRTDPCTNEMLPTKNLVPCTAPWTLVQQWREQHPEYRD